MNPIVSGMVANTAAANPLGIITDVTLLSNLENPRTSAVCVIMILPTYIATAAIIPNMTYSIWPKLASTVLQRQRRML